MERTHTDNSCSSRKRIPAVQPRKQVQLRHQLHRTQLLLRLSPAPANTPAEPSTPSVTPDISRNAYSPPDPASPILLELRISNSLRIGTAGGMKSFENRTGSFQPSCSFSTSYMDPG